MIVDPDFFDHWRTRMVVDMLGGDALAPVYIMRLWSHCQNRKGDTFAIPPSGIKALCHFSGDASALEEALIAAEYLIRDGAQVTVVGWAQKNAQLIAAWENGARGGRPRKDPIQIPQECDGKPEANPKETQGKPVGNPYETDKRREDKRREEKREGDPIGSLSASPPQARQLSLGEPENRVCVRSESQQACPHDKILDAYEAALPALPQVRRSLFVRGKNFKALRSRWQWVMKAKHESGECTGTRLATTIDDGVQWFGNYFEYVSRSDFLTGRNGRFTGCDIGWLVNADNFEKVLSGKYHFDVQGDSHA